MVGTQNKNKKENKIWFDEECKIAIRTRDEAYQAFLNRPTRGKKHEMDRLSKIVHNICRRKKRKYKKEKIDEINEKLS